MHEDFEYDDDHDYDDSQNSNDSSYKHYFKFDPSVWDAWGKWLYSALNDITEISPHVWHIYGSTHKKFPVTESFPKDTEKNHPFLYLGSNQYQEPIWKKKYFVIQPLQIEFIKHLQSHAKHFLQQPAYYKDLFNILN